MGGCLVKGGLLPRGCAWSKGVCSQGGAWSRGVCSQRGAGWGVWSGGVWISPLMATAAGGTHPTGMNSCDLTFLSRRLQSM